MPGFELGATGCEAWKLSIVLCSPPSSWPYFLLTLGCQKASSCANLPFFSNFGFWINVYPSNKVEVENLTWLSSLLPPFFFRNVSNHPYEGKEKNKIELLLLFSSQQTGRKIILSSGFQLFWDTKKTLFVGNVTSVKEETFLGWIKLRKKNWLVVVDRQQMNINLTN